MEPKRETKWYARRLPRPVLMNPRAKKKASAISQGMGSPKAENAAEKVRVLVRTDAPRPINATAPRGRGWVMMPTMVARKIARSCHALRATPAGAGMNQIRTPVRIDAAKGLRAAPCHGCGAADGAGVEAESETEAWIVVKREVRWRSRGKKGWRGLGLAEICGAGMEEMDRALRGWQERRRRWRTESDGAPAPKLQVRAEVAIEEGARGENFVRNDGGGGGLSATCFYLLREREERRWTILIWFLNLRPQMSQAGAVRKKCLLAPGFVLPVSSLVTCAALRLQSLHTFRCMSATRHTVAHV